MSSNVAVPSLRNRIALRESECRGVCVLPGVGSPYGAQLRAGSLSGDTMTLGRHYLIAPLLVGVVILPSTAYAKAPSQAHVRFRVPSTLGQPVPITASSSGDGTIGGFVYWIGGKSRTRGVSCCRNTITDLASGVRLGTTTLNRLPVTMRLGLASINYRVRSRDGRGRLVGSVVTDPAVSYFDGYADDEPGYGSFSGSWLTTSDARNYGGTVESSSTAGDSFTYDAGGSAVAWVAITGPNHGSAKVYIDGVLVRMVSTYSNTIHRRRLVWAKRWGALPLAFHTIRIVNVATPGHPRITVDAMAYLSDD